VTRLAEDYVIDETQRHVEPLIEIAEDAVNARGLKFLAKDAEAIATARAELAEYRRDPRGYIRKLIAGGGPAVAGEIDPKAPLKDQVLFWKHQIREHFEKTLDRLVFDLRIFTGSNLVAAVVVFGLAYAGRRDRVPRLVFVALLLLTSVAFMCYVYVDELSYFKILVGSYMGWWYPALLGLTFLGAYVEYGPRSARPD
jgi:hypothetical protein